LRIATVVGAGARHTSSPWSSQVFEKLGAKTRQTLSLPYSADDPLTLVQVEDVARMLVTMIQTGSLKSCIYNTPAELWRAGEVKRAVETVDSNVETVLAGRKRALAPIAEGRKFIKEFRFETPSLKGRLEKQARVQCSAAPGFALTANIYNVRLPFDSDVH